MINHFIHNATIWRSTPDGMGGYSFSAPIKAACRWEERTELIPGSETIVSKAIAYLNVDVTVEDYIYPGKTTSADPTAVVGACRVAGYKKIPNLRNLETLRKAWLV